MTRRRIVTLVTRRELRERARTRSFLVATALLVAAAVAAGVIPAFLDNDPSPVDVGVVGQPPAGLRTALTTAAGEREVRVVPFDSVDQGDAALRAGDVDVVVAGPDLRVHGDRTSEGVEDFARRLAATVPLNAMLESAGLPPERLAAATPLPIQTLETPREEDSSRDVVFLGVFVLYMALMGYGNWVAAGVLEEKASRVVEVVLSAVRPSELLAGKVFGLGLLGLGQIVVVGAAGLIAALLAGVDLPSSAPQGVGLVVLWFILGFAFYSCAFAAFGAAASRQEDAQAAMSPLVGLLVGGFLLSTFVQANPDGLLARISPFVPPLAPLTVPARVLLGHPGWWELPVSVALMAATSVGLVRLGARAYGGAVLRFGPKLSLPELWRSHDASSARGAVPRAEGS